MLHPHIVPCPRLALYMRAHKRAPLPRADTRMPERHPREPRAGVRAGARVREAAPLALLHAAALAVELAPKLYYSNHECPYAVLQTLRVRELHSVMKRHM